MRAGGSGEVPLAITNTEMSNREKETKCRNSG
jgi:hypothetical protein